MGADRCVSCGAIVPEGRMVCKKCELESNATKHSTKRTSSPESIKGIASRVFLAIILAMAALQATASGVEETGYAD